MNFVQSLNLFGIPAKEIPSLTGKGAPTASTAAAVGCLYMDEDTGELYKCTKQLGDVFTWENVGIGAAVSYKEQDLTEEQKAQARENIGSIGWDELTSALGEAIYETEVNIIDVEGRTLFDFPALAFDATYTVVVNGVKYVSKVLYDEMMGDATLCADGYVEPDNCPIYIMTDTNGGAVYFFARNEQYGTYKVGIYCGDANVKPISEAYIPDTIARKTDITWENLPDKPFGADTEVILPETTCEFTEDDTVHALPEFPLLIDGETYVVHCNGVKYEMVAVHDEMMETYHLSKEDENGNAICPICFDQYYDNNVESGVSCDVTFAGNQYGSYTFSITRGELKTVDEEYIPDTIARKSDVTWENLPDKPFYSERTLIADVESFDEGGVYIDAPELILGDTYIVEAYGQEAACESYYEESANACCLTMPDDGDLFDLGIAYEYDKGKLFMSTMGLPTPIKLYHIELKTIDEQYLPYKTEEWTFELADGSTVTKQVVVK